MRRKLFDKLKTHLSKKEFIVLTGARQTGKSTLLKQVEIYCREQAIPTIFLNLEQKTILADLDNDPLNLLKYIPQTEQRVIVLVDEVQYLKDPSNFMKLMFDEHWQKLKLVVTGSSAFYIDDSFKDSLAGRKRLFQLYTCSFDEYLALTGKGELLQEKERIEHNPTAKSNLLPYLKNEWENYMLYGGYPAVILEEDPKEKILKLQEIRDSFIKRDILESGVENETAFFHLFRLLASQAGQLLNTNELSITLRIKHTTVTNYLWVMQKCFHVSLVKPFFQNLRKELTKMPKVFLLDSGLRNSLLNNFEPIQSRTDKGELWETICYKLLVESFGTDEINYWRTSDGNEVDFILPNLNKQSMAIEAKFNEALIKPSKYKKFISTYPTLPLHYAFMEPFNEDFFRRIKI